MSLAGNQLETGNDSPVLAKIVSTYDFNDPPEKRWRFNDENRIFIDKVHHLLRNSSMCLGYIRRAENKHMQSEERDPTIIKNLGIIRRAVNNFDIELGRYENTTPLRMLNEIIGASIDEINGKLEKNHNLPKKLEESHNIINSALGNYKRTVSVLDMLDSEEFIPYQSLLIDFLEYNRKNDIKETNQLLESMMEDLVEWKKDIYLTELLEEDKRVSYYLEKTGRGDSPYVVSETIREGEKESYHLSVFAGNDLLRRDYSTLSELRDAHKAVVNFIKGGFNVQTMSSTLYYLNKDVLNVPMSEPNKFITDVMFEKALHLKVGEEDVTIVNCMVGGHPCNFTKNCKDDSFRVLPGSTIEDIIGHLNQEGSYGNGDKLYAALNNNL